MSSLDQHWVPNPEAVPFSPRCPAQEKVDLTQYLLDALPNTDSEPNLDYGAALGEWQTHDWSLDWMREGAGEGGEVGGYGERAVTHSRCEDEAAQDSSSGSMESGQAIRMSTPVSGATRPCFGGTPVHARGPRLRD